MTPFHEDNTPLLAVWVVVALILFFALTSCDVVHVFDGAVDPQVREPTPAMLALYAEAADCLDAEVDVGRVTWYSATSLFAQEQYRRGVWVPPHSIYLTEWVWDHLADEQAQIIVRHEAVHEITGDLDHQGPHWVCDGGFR